MCPDPIVEEVPFVSIVVKPISCLWLSGCDFENKLKNCFHPFEVVLTIFYDHQKSSKPIVPPSSKISMFDLQKILNQA